MLKDLLSGLFLIVVLQSCNQQNLYNEISKTPEGSATYGGLIRIPNTENFQTLYPPESADKVSGDIISQIYEGLTFIDPQSGLPSPGLAEKWIMNEDATSFIFFIKKNVLFHDDDEANQAKERLLTARDVEFCFARLCSDFPGNNGFRFFKDRVVGANEYFEASSSGKTLGKAPEGIKVLNDHTIQIDLKFPSPQFLEILSVPNTFIYLPELAESFSEDMQRKAVGTGPFRLKKISDSSVLLERNEKYHKKDVWGNRLPYISAIKFYTETANNRISLIREGKAEIVSNFSPKELRFIGSEDSSFTRVSADLGGSFFFIAFSDHKIFKNKEIRKAIAMAINRAEIAKFLYSGKALPLEGSFSPSFIDAEKSGNVRTTKKESEDKTIADITANALQEDLKGLKIKVGSARENLILAVALQKMLQKELNVSAEIIYSDAALTDPVLYLVEQPKEFSHPENYLFHLSTEFLSDPNQSKFFFDEQFNNYFKSALKEFEPKNKPKGFLRVENYATEEFLAVPLVFKSYTAISSPNIKGLILRSNGTLELSQTFFDQ
jgi:oligopeptide transport system substrate-binding protein